AGINRGGVNAAVELARGVLSWPGRHNLQTGNRRRVAMPLPTDESGNAVTVFHPGALEKPVVWFGANPIGAARHRTGAVRADEFVRIGPLVRQRFHRDEIARTTRRSENTHTFESAMGRAARVRRKQNSATHRVAGKKSH